MSRPSLPSFSAVFAAATLWAAPVAAHSGPPLICFPFEIGDAPSLPFGDDAFSTSVGYDTRNLVKDTVRLLRAEESALVRMETLRRAAVYLQSDRSRAMELLARLSSDAIDADASKDSRAAARAWFDAAILVGCLRHVGLELGWKPGALDGVAGYAWVCKALACDPGNPEMEFGAALVAVEKRDDSYKAHLRRAVAGTSPATPLARSIEANLRFGGKPFENLCDELGVRHADARPDKK